MMRVVMVALLLLGAAACKKKPGLVDTPVAQIDPLGGGVKPVPMNDEEAAQQQPQQPQLQPAAAPDGGVAHQKVIVAPKTTATPTVASPYIPGGGKEHLPLWRQRAKFY